MLMLLVLVIVAGGSVHINVVGAGGWCWWVSSC